MGAGNDFAQTTPLAMRYLYRAATLTRQFFHFGRNSLYTSNMGVSKSFT